MELYFFFVSKKVFALILSAFLCVCVYSQESSGIQKLRVSSFNDSWGGGLTQIKDDHRTFGFSIEAEANLWRKSPSLWAINYSDFTNRWAANPTRVDELAVSASLPIYKSSKFISLNALAGGYVIGDLGGGSFQNFVHDRVGVPRIELEYSTNNTLYGLIGGQVFSELIILEGSHPLTFLPSILYSWAPNYLQTYRGSGIFQYKNLGGDQIEVEVGYESTDVFTELTRRSVARVENGVYVQYKMNLGLLSYGFKVFPQTNYSYGYLGINLYNSNERSPMQTVDALVEFGAIQDGRGLYLRWLSGFNKGYMDHFQWDVHYQFWTLTRSKLPGYPNRMGHYQQMSLGLQYSLFKPKPHFQVIPYASARFGVKSESTYAGEVPGPDIQVYSLNSVIEGGLRIVLPSGFIHPNCYYGFTMNYQLLYTLYKEVPSNSTYTFGDNYAYGGLGLFVMVDF